MKIYLAILWNVFFLFSVKNQTIAQDVILNFEHVAGKEKMSINKGEYRNAFGEKYTLSVFKYFISNIKLIKADGTFWEAKNQYFLVDEKQEDSKKIVLNNVPIGNYVTLRFTIGVDSIKSASNISQRKGVLDVSKTDMYWSWNSGYIFLKIEGNSMAADTPKNHFQYHIGGFGGYSGETANNIKEIQFDLTKNNLKKTPKKITEIKLKVDAEHVFATNVSIAKVNDIATPKQGKIIADNYAKMFSLTEIKYEHD